MWRNKYFLTALLLCIISIASLGITRACGVSHTHKGDFVVLTSFYPMYIATVNITDGVDGVQVKNLAENTTGCLHDYQLSTKDLKLLDSADMLIANGADMEMFLEDVYSQYKDLVVVKATDNIELLKTDMEAAESEEYIHEAEDEHVHETEDEHVHETEDEHVHETEDEHVHETEDEHVHETEDEHVHETEDEHVHETEDEHAHESEEEHAHSHGAYNAHSWMDISLYITEVRNIAYSLMENDPENSTLYEENLHKYEAKLNSLLEHAQEVQIDGNAIVFHEGFAYLQNTHKFNVSEIIDMDHNTNLSAATVGRIIDMVNSGKVQYIIADKEYGEAAADAIKKECNVKVVYLNPLTAGDYDKDSYINGMEENIHILKEAAD